MYKLECPYCENKIEIDYFEEDYFEVECHHCNEQFKVNVEFEPYFNTSKFNIVKCEKCNEEFDKTYLSRHPASKGYNSKSSLCKNCYFELMSLED